MQRDIAVQAGHHARHTEAIAGFEIETLGIRDSEVLGRRVERFKDAIGAGDIDAELERGMKVLHTSHAAVRDVLCGCEMGRW